MKKILVVDDEKPISDIIKFNLKKEAMMFTPPMMVKKPCKKLKKLIQT